MPLPEVASVISTLPADEETWIHCAAGYRAAIAASMLSAGLSLSWWTTFSTTPSAPASR